MPTQMDVHPSWPWVMACRHGDVDERHEVTAPDEEPGDLRRRLKANDMQLEQETPVLDLTPPPCHATLGFLGVQSTHNFVWFF